MLQVVADWWTLDDDDEAEEPNKFWVLFLLLQQLTESKSLMHLPWLLPIIDKSSSLIDDYTSLPEEPNDNWIIVSESNMDNPILDEESEPNLQSYSWVIYWVVLWGAIGQYLENMKASGDPLFPSLISLLWS